MRRLCPIIAALVTQWCAPVPALAAEPCPGVEVGGVCVIPAGDCADERVLLGGRLFTQDREPAPWCDGVVPPPGEYARLQGLDDEARALRVELDAARAMRAADRRQADRDLGACQEGRRACEADRTVCPPCPEPGMSPWAAGVVGGGAVAVVFTVLLLVLH